MKQRISAFIVTLAMVLLASPAFAQEVRVNVDAKATSTPVKARAELRTEIQTKKASSTERRVEMQKGLAKKKAAHTSRVMAATVERLEKIIERLESRIAKVKANGAVTVEAEAFVAEAKTYLSAAKSNIALFASLDLSGDKAQENFERIRALAQETKEHIRAAHQSLMKAIRALGRVRADARGNATSTLKIEN